MTHIRWGLVQGNRGFSFLVIARLFAFLHARDPGIMHMLYWSCMEVLIDLCLVSIDWTVRYMLRADEILNERARTIGA